jgi:hypothetical protein
VSRAPDSASSAPSEHGANSEGTATLIIKSFNEKQRLAISIDVKTAKLS